MFSGGGASRRICQRVMHEIPSKNHVPLRRKGPRLRAAQSRVQRGQVSRARQELTWSKVGTSGCVNVGRAQERLQEILAEVPTATPSDLPRTLNKFLPGRHLMGARLAVCVANLRPMRGSSLPPLLAHHAAESVRSGTPPCTRCWEDSVEMRNRRGVPLRLGGHGLRSAVRLSSGAFWASWAVAHCGRSYLEISDLEISGYQRSMRLLGRVTIWAEMITEMCAANSIVFRIN